MYKTKIENCDNKLLDKQKQALINDIVFGEPADYFKIYALEACTGKTRTAEFALAKMIKETNRNAIFVRTFNNDCDESAKFINDMVGEEVALAYYNKGFSKETKFIRQKDFPKYRILIITHKRYIELSRDSTQKHIFTNNRNVLVIDEYINDVEKLVLSFKRIETYKAILRFDSTIYDKYTTLIKPVENLSLREYSIRDYIRVRIAHKIPTDKAINELIRLIRINITDDGLKQILESSMILRDRDDLDINFLETISSVRDLCREIEDIQQFYCQTVILHDNTLYAPDSRIGYWALDNNIILDASADLQTGYTERPKLFKIIVNEKVLDHSHWTITNILANTISSNKDKIENFYDVINKYLANIFDVDDLLIIGNKKDIDFITTVKKENRAYFGNLIGSNEWSEIKNVAIIHTQNISDVDYLLKYLHYFRGFLGSKSKWTAQKTGRDLTSLYQFTDDEMESYRVRYIAEQIYQAIKRINRRMDGESKVILMCNYEQVVNLIRDNLKGCKFETIDEIGFKYMETKQNQYITKLKSNSYANKYKTLITEIVYGNHPNLIYDEDINYLILKKKSVREYLGGNTAANFNHQVLEKTEVIEYNKIRGILTQGQYIKIPRTEKVVSISI